MTWPGLPARSVATLRCRLKRTTPNLCCAFQAKGRVIFTGPLFFCLSIEWCYPRFILTAAAFCFSALHVPSVGFLLCYLVVKVPYLITLIVYTPLHRLSMCLGHQFGNS